MIAWVDGLTQYPLWDFPFFQNLSYLSYTKGCCMRRLASLKLQRKQRASGHCFCNHFAYLMCTCGVLVCACKQSVLSVDVTCTCTCSMYNMYVLVSLCSDAARALVGWYICTCIHCNCTCTCIQVMHHMYVHARHVMYMLHGVHRGSKGISTLARLHPSLTIYVHVHTCTYMCTHSLIHVHTQCVHSYITYL